MKKLAIVLLLFSACASTKPAALPCNPGLALVNATAWLQTSAEYRALATQTYAVARNALDVVLATPLDKPPAVILDLDETAMLNLPFEARMVKQGKSYDPAAWSQWVSESAATAVPGAAEFLAYARSRGVTPFYVTNRMASEEAATRRNLETLGYPLDAKEDTILTRGERPEWSTADKTPRRDYVASRYRVLLLFGDDLNDFVSALGMTGDQRFDLIRANRDKWGTSWFILPNPAYGSWETTVAGSGTACEQLKRKIEALK
ncbi:MAG TPA: HAD family acid phosphatase [Thermoanaerobaculia bacterium]